MLAISVNPTDLSIGNMRRKIFSMYLYKYILNIIDNRQ
jgi:hypothetical protein